MLRTLSRSAFEDSFLGQWYPSGLPVGSDSQHPPEQSRILYRPGMPDQQGTSQYLQFGNEASNPDYLRRSKCHCGTEGIVPGNNLEVCV